MVSPLPSFSCDVRVGSSLAAIEVDPEVINRGLDDIGATPAVRDATTIHFTDLGNTGEVGAIILGNWLSCLVFKAYTFHENFRDLGYGRHQTGKGNKIALNVNREGPARTRPELARRLPHLADQISALTDDDCMSLILGHELMHGQASLWRVAFQRKREERRVDAYIAQCIERGKGNPWLGAISLKYK